MNKKTKLILIVSVAALLIGLTLVAVFSELLAGNATSVGLTRVACLGDSITEQTGYPQDLQILLGNGSLVGNFGVTGSTVLFESEAPYYFEHTFYKAKLFAPTTVIIMLGTNDAHNDVYQYTNNFVSDYEKTIHSVQALQSKPQIFIVEPPPVFENSLGINGTAFAQGIIPRIQEVAAQLDLPLIDAYTPLLSHPEYFPDGIHPDGQGAQIIADIVYNAIN